MAKRKPAQRAPRQLAGIRVDAHSITTSILTALVLFLSGWVWKMETRVTTLEVKDSANADTLKEIKDGVKDLNNYIRDHR